MKPSGTLPLLSNLSATKDDPLYTTYAAPLSRSAFTLDQGYRLRIDEEGIRFAAENAGELALAFKHGGEIRYFLHQLTGEPRVTASYSDLVKFSYVPFEGLTVDVVFQVYSSRLTLQDVTVTNGGERLADLTVYPFLYHRDGMRAVEAGPHGRHVLFTNVVEPDEWVKSHDMPFIRDRMNVLMLGSTPDSYGLYKDRGTNGLEPETFFGDLHRPSLSGGELDRASVVGFQMHFTLAPGAAERLRIVRGVTPADAGSTELLAAAEELLTYDTDQAVSENEALYSRIPPAPTSDRDLQMVYWSAFSLLRQVMLPPEGASSYNYYVFSREPTWGWGHGGQVFHESLAMLAYVYMDPESALNSQRVYFERQHEDGYINYRTGAYLDETIPTNGDLTTSAPWLSWENWELYRVTRDRSFLAEAYDAGIAFYEWWMANRDEDGDGLAEWGGHAVLESVRDGQVALWDEVGWPSNFEAMDLNVMLVKEARSLAQMAEELGYDEASAGWVAEAAARAQAVRETFWDEETGFFYHVDRDDHDYTFSDANDLKRQEIIGFLPLWAGAATDGQASRLVEHLTNEDTFWRLYGIPTLAANDAYYNPMGYWNGPVWVQWQYLIFRGLLDYGYDELAKELARKVLESVSHHLAESHTFWELYSPDDLRAGFHQTYIWTGIVARMMLDLNGLTPIPTIPSGHLPVAMELENYPNPFSAGTTVSYWLPESGDVRVTVYDLFGRRVAELFEGRQEAGHHAMTWDASRGSPAIAGGVYFIRLEQHGVHRIGAVLYIP
jgi:hypothetical protein